MRIELLAAMVLLPSLLSAQERYTIKGRIVDEHGEAVEYVQVGMPKLQIGAVSTVDGRKKASSWNPAGTSSLSRLSDTTHRHCRPTFPYLRKKGITGR